MESAKIVSCKHCGNTVEFLYNSGNTIICCGDPMTEVVANTTEAATEKHIPVMKLEDNILTVTVGEVAHPMEEKHYITSIYIETEKGKQKRMLSPGEEPKATFCIAPDDKVLKAFAWCNIHGLWSASM